MNVYAVIIGFSISSIALAIILVIIGKWIWGGIGCISSCKKLLWTPFANLEYRLRAIEDKVGAIQVKYSKGKYRFTYGKAIDVIEYGIIEL